MLDNIEVLDFQLLAARQNLCCHQAALMASKTEKGALMKAAKKAEAILKEMVSMTLRSNLTRIQRISLETCITVHMHQKECTGRV